MEKKTSHNAEIQRQGQELPQISHRKESFTILNKILKRSSSSMATSESQSLYNFIECVESLMRYLLFIVDFTFLLTGLVVGFSETKHLQS